MYIEIYVTAKGSLKPDHALHLTGPLVLGRQITKEEPFGYDPSLGTDGYPRFVMAQHDENTVGRSHVLLEPLGPDRVRITTKTDASNVVVNGATLRKGQSKELAVPPAGLLAHLGDSRTVKILLAAPGSDGTDTIATVAPGALEDEERFAAGDRAAQRLGRLKVVLEVLRNRQVPEETCCFRAARAVTTVAELGTGHVLLREDGAWVRKISMRKGDKAPFEPGAEPDPLLDRLLEAVSKGEPALLPLDGAGRKGRSGPAAAAVPILDKNRKVIGALCGGPGPDAAAVTDADVLLLGLLADALADRLAAGRYEPRDLQVTTLFCDIRRFTQLSTRLGPAGTMRWINEVLEALTECVIAEGGVIGDYVGDELMAMWGAGDRPFNQATLACRAALRMLAKRDELNAAWRDELGAEMDFGIGINTGNAYVGNVGTKSTPKYGPLGHMVNIASRAQGATKYLRARVLMTEWTFGQLEPDLKARSRRVGKVRMVGLDPLQMYELAPPGQQPWPAWKEHYERALRLFEDGRFRIADKLAPLYDEGHNDGPSIALLARAVNALAYGAAPGHPVLMLDAK